MLIAGNAHGRGGPLSREREDSAPLTRVASSRSALYHTLSQSLVYPESARLQELRRSARRLQAARSAVFTRFPYVAQVDRLVACIAALDTAACTALQGEYLRLFAHRAGASALAPYESAFLTAPGGAPGLCIGSVEREYAAAGIAVAPAAGEQADHIAVELGFVGALCGWEAEAWRNENVSGAFGALRAQQRFLAGHLRRWLPQLAASVRQSAEGTLFDFALDAADALTSHDAAFVEPLIDAIREELDSVQGSAQREATR